MHSTVVLYSWSDHYFCCFVMPFLYCLCVLLVVVEVAPCWLCKNYMVDMLASLKLKSSVGLQSLWRLVLLSALVLASVQVLVLACKLLAALGQSGMDNSW
jgi:hypothetical protein